MKINPIPNYIWFLNIIKFLNSYELSFLLETDSLFTELTGIYFYTQYVDSIDPKHQAVFTSWYNAIDQAYKRKILKYKKKMKNIGKIHDEHCWLVHKCNCIAKYSECDRDLLTFNYYRRYNYVPVYRKHTFFIFNNEFIVYEYNERGYSIYFWKCINGYHPSTHIISYTISEIF